MNTDQQIKAAINIRLAVGCYLLELLHVHTYNTKTVNAKCMEYIGSHVFILIVRKSTHINIIQPRKENYTLTLQTYDT